MEQPIYPESSAENVEKISTLNVRLPLIFAALVAVGMFVGTRLPRYDRDFAFLKKSETPLLGARLGGSLEELLGYVEARYVDSVNGTELKNRAIEAFLKGLDPHSVFIPREEVEAVAEEMQGEFEGIGIEFLIVEDTLQVVAPLAGGPSEAAGIMAGDKIILINDTTIAGVKVDNSLIFKKLRGPKNSPVKLSVLRGREKGLRVFDIRRDKIPIHSVDVAYMLDERTAFLKINRFSATTYQEFMEKLVPFAEARKGAGMDLLLDLRGNPGGYLESATDILSQFFGQDRLLVYTEGRQDAKQEYKASGRARLGIENLVVLIDEGSASASEIIAGAVQDHDRGWIVGRRSFGKGLVQEQYPLRDGSAIRLTIARYFTPSGRCIQKDYKKDRLAYERDLEQRAEKGELTDEKKGGALADSSKFYTAGGRIVFGGGGISPDFFVPLDTSFSSNYFYEIQPFLAQFAQKMIENGSAKAPDGGLAAFLKDFMISEKSLEELAFFAEKNGVKRNATQFARSKNELRLRLKARLGKLFFKEEGLWSVINADDPAVEKARAILRSPVKK